MHLIRLREPWTARLDADSRVFIYERKFHRPTGVDAQSIQLRVELHHASHGNGELGGADGQPLCAYINGHALVPIRGSPEEIHFKLAELLAFNSLELRLRGREIDCALIPAMNSFGIRSVALVIE